MKWIWRKFHLNTLKTQLTAALFFVSLLSGITCAYILYFNSVSILNNNVIEQNMAHIIQLSHNLGYRMNELSMVSLSLFSSNRTTEIINYKRLADYKSITAFGEYLDMLDLFALRNTLAEAVFIYSNNGIIIGRDDKSNLFIQNYIHIRQTKNRITFDSKIFGRLEDSYNRMLCLGTVNKKDLFYLDLPIVDYPVITFGTQYKTLDKHRIIVTFVISEEMLRRQYQQTSYGLGEMYVIDSDGMIISHSDQKLLGSRARLFSEDWLVSGNFSIADNNQKYLITCSRIGESDLYLVSEMLSNDIIAEINGIRQLMILCVTIGTLALIPISMLIIQIVLSPMRKLSNSIQSMEMGNFEQTIDDVPDNEIGMVIDQFNVMARSISNLTKLNHENAAMRRNAEIQALQAYINPHYLHNTIMTLRYMAVMVNANRLAEALSAFGNTLVAIYSTEQPMWRISDERAFIMDYVKVMNYRFGSGVNVNINVSDNLLDCYILKFVVQPMVENAFSYGIDPALGMGEINIAFENEGSDIIIIVSDKGAGIASDKLLKLNEALLTETVQYSVHGMGLPNVAARIRLHFGDMYNIHINSGTNGTTVSMRLPFIKDKTDGGVTRCTE